MLEPIDEAANNSNKKNVELFIPLPLKDRKNAGSFLYNNAEVNKKWPELALEDKIHPPNSSNTIIKE